MSRFFIVCSLLITLAAAALAGCNGNTGNDYVFRSLTASPGVARPGEKVLLHASVWDPYCCDEEKSVYQFEASGGELSASKGPASIIGPSVRTKNRSVFWIPPAEPGMYTLTATYATVSKSVQIRVVAPQ